MDFLSFALDLVAAEMKLPREHLRPLERKIRQEQGGDRHYIVSVAAMNCQERHAAIRAARAAGLCRRRGRSIRGGVVSGGVWSVDCLVVAHPLAGGRFVRSRFEGLRFDENRCGFAGSPTSVNKIESVVLAGGEFKEVAATDEGIGALVSELIKDHTIG